MSAPATSVHTAPLDLGVLRGKTLVAWAQASDYWHMQVDVQDEAGACYSFTTDDQMPGPLFEVFALQLAHGGKPANPWQPLKRPFRVAAATPLWRTEWLEPLSEAGDTLGHAPHVHHAGRGTRPSVGSGQSRGACACRRSLVQRQRRVPGDLGLGCGVLQRRDPLARHGRGRAGRFRSHGL